MTQNILLIGRNQAVIDEILQLDMPGFRLFGGTDIEAVRATGATAHIDHVIVGGGLPLEDRLDIVREIFHLNDATKVHMNSPSGPQTFLPFVRSVLYGLVDSDNLSSRE